MYFTDVPADHLPPHALLCVELCVSAELHRTVFMTAQQHSSGSLDICLRQRIAQNSGSLHVNSQDSGVTTRVLFLSTWPQFISNNIEIWYIRDSFLLSLSYLGNNFPIWSPPLN